MSPEPASRRGLPGAQGHPGSDQTPSLLAGLPQGPPPQQAESRWPIVASFPVSLKICVYLKITIKNNFKIIYIEKYVIYNKNFRTQI